MATHAAGHRHHGNYHGTRHRPIAAHLRAPGQPRWWNTDRGRELARDIGDFVDELHQLTAVAVTAVVLLGVIYLATAAIWPIEPHVATGFAAAAIAGLALTVWRMRRRP